MRNGADAGSWPQVTLCNFRFASNWPVLLESERLLETARATVLLIKTGDLSKTPCVIVLLLEIGVKTLCATAVLLQIGPYC